MSAENSEHTDVAAGNEADPAGDLLWGVNEISRFIRRSRRQTYYLIDRGVIPVRRLSHKVIAGSRAEIRAVFKAPHS